MPSPSQLRSAVPGPPTGGRAGRHPGRPPVRPPRAPRPAPGGRARRGPGAADAALPGAPGAPPRGGARRGRPAAGLAGRDLVGLAPPNWPRHGAREAAFWWSTSRRPAAGPASPRSRRSAPCGCAGCDGGALLHAGGSGAAHPAGGDRADRDRRRGWSGQPGHRGGARRLRRLRREDVLVAHNAPFDLRFLNYERRRLAGGNSHPALAGHPRPVQRLLNGRVERHDLRSLAEWADTAVRPYHRALPDAEATAELLRRAGRDAGRARQRHAGERGRVRRSGGARYGTSSRSRRTCRPAGVYLMRDRGGKVLYVGKAGNLRRRVLLLRPGRAPRAAHRAGPGRPRSLDHELCGPEFEALLREDHLIRDLPPPGNRRGAVGGVPVPQARAGRRRARIYPVPRPAPRRRGVLGPVRSAVSPSRALPAPPAPSTRSASRTRPARRRRCAGPSSGEPGASRSWADGRPVGTRPRPPRPTSPHRPPAEHLGARRGPPPCPRGRRAARPCWSSRPAPRRAARGLLRRRRGGAPPGAVTPEAWRSPAAGARAAPQARSRTAAAVPGRTPETSRRSADRRRPPAPAGRSGPAGLARPPWRVGRADEPGARRGRDARGRAATGMIGGRGPGRRRARAERPLRGARA